MKDYVFWMNRILQRAKNLNTNEIPIYAIVLDKEGKCIGRGSNQRERWKDPLGHAEIIAIRQASWIIGDWRLNECSLIVNLEPCTMCAASIIQSRIGTTIYGAHDKKRGGLGGTIDLSRHESCHHKMKVFKGVLEDKASKEIESWFKKMRDCKLKI
tara:strand:- start:9747 stop:10214 length:468 start_codon:yes stop_codon:yes gene_type:complete